MITRTGAAALGALGAAATAVGIAATGDKTVRRELHEAAVTVVAAVPIGMLTPLRWWGARKVSPEAVARLLRARTVGDDGEVGARAFEVWTFALTGRTGLVWLHDGRGRKQRWRLGDVTDFRRHIRVSTLLPDREDND